MAEASGAWSIAAGFAAQPIGRAVRHFYALYEGAAFDAPERGAAAIIASAHLGAAAGEAARNGGRDAAQIAVHSFAEGFFGAQRTLSARRAALVALSALNRWLAGQLGGGQAAHLAPVSLSGILFQGGGIGLAQIGQCLLYRLRGAKLTPLMRGHFRPGEAGALPARALGLDHELTLDFEEDEAAPGDVFLLVAGLETEDGVYAALAPLLSRLPADETELAQAVLAALTPLPAADKAVMALRLLAMPDGPPTANEAAELAELPIRTPPREGEVLDDFVIGRLLYRGRYTMLVAAYDRQGKREVALKIPLPSMLQDEIFTAGFMREAWIGSTLRGQSVAHYLTLPPGRRSALYLVLPLYQGDTLEKRLARPPLMSLPEGLGIAFRLCEAVQDLAAIQVVHRDIKPENVMLLENGEVRLLDLGLAYLPGIDAETAARPGGTIRYMAPELLRGVPAGPRSEVFALGVTMYRMFSGGAFPFGQHEKRPLQRLRPDLPAWLGEILARALHDREEARFADAGELAQALQTQLVAGRDAPPPPRGGIFADRLRLWQGVALLFAIGFFVLLVRALR